MTETWQEETEKQLDELEEDAGDIGHHTIYNGVIRRERVNKFITDIRKQDEEELIKMLPKYSPFRDLTSSTINQCVDNFKKTIQDYYNK